MLARITVHTARTLTNDESAYNRIAQALLDLNLAQNVSASHSASGSVVHGDFINISEANLGKSLMLLKTVSPVIDFIACRH